MFKLFKRHLSIYQKLAMFTDALIIFGLFVLSVVLADFLKLFRSFNLQLVQYINNYWLIILLSTGVLIYLLHKNSSYNFNLPGIRYHLGRLPSPIFSFSLFTAFLLFILDLDNFSRSVFMLQLLLLGLVLPAKRIIECLFIRKFNKYIEPHGILVVGTSNYAKELVHKILTERISYLMIFGFLSYEDNPVEKDIFSIPVLGSVKDFQKVLENRVIDDIILVEDEENSLLKHKNFIAEVVQMGLGIEFYSPVYSTFFSRLSIESIKNITLLGYNPTGLKDFELFIKQLLDYFFAALLTIVLLPLLGLTALLVKLTSPGPVIYKQPRVNKHGRIFEIYKFRSMVQNADKQLPELIASYKENKDSGKEMFKIENDTRITPLGKFLRKFSLDELPQLLNILKGDMSFVGPRPPLVFEYENMDYWHKRILSIKPGLTCLWQISGRSEIRKMKERTELDYRYIDNWSLWLDLKIVLKTIPLVIFGVGAK